MQRAIKAAAIAGFPAAAAMYYTWKIDSLDRADTLRTGAVPLLEWADLFWVAVLYGFLLLALSWGLSKLSEVSLPAGSGWEKPVPLLAGAALLYVCWLPFLMVFYPAPGMNDTVYILNHPLLACIQFPWLYSLMEGGAGEWALRYWGTREPAVFALALVQMGLSAWILAGTARKISFFTGNRLVGWGLLLYFAFFPMVGNYAGAAVKDTAYSLTLFLWVFFFLDLARGKTGSPAREGALLLGTMLFRSNGLPGAILLGVAAARRRKWKRTLFLLAVCAAAAVVPARLILWHIGEEPLFQEAAAVPLQQMGRVLTAGGALQPEAKDFLEELLPEEQWKASYSPFTVDFVKWHEGFQRDILNEKKGDFLKFWIETGADHPRLYMEGWMTETYAVWNLDPLEHQVQSRFGWALTDENTENMKPEQNDMMAVGGLPIRAKLKSFLAVWQYEGSRFLGAGFSLWLTVLACAVFYVQKRSRYILMAVPVFVNAATLLAATPASAVFRYSFIYVLFLPALWIVVFSQRKKDVQ